MSNTLNAYNLSQSIVEKLSSFVNYGISSQKVSQLAFVVMFVVSLILYIWPWRVPLLHGCCRNVRNVVNLKLKRLANVPKKKLLNELSKK